MTCKCERPIASSRKHVCKTCGETISLARAVWTEDEEEADDSLIPEQESEYRRMT